MKVFGEIHYSKHSEGERKPNSQSFLRLKRPLQSDVFSMLSNEIRESAIRNRELQRASALPFDYVSWKTQIVGEELAKNHFHSAKSFDIKKKIQITKNLTSFLKKPDGYKKIMDH
ncbi:hypothetical protein [Caballeronia calidae]|uniref:hypothetical protein n=1 Tax=Caballeronia calidae TaxID=1777139 RepID=UPI000AB8BFA4|nr:hypothetical protein [Caballeronia calidae]